MSTYHSTAQTVKGKPASFHPRKVAIQRMWRGGPLREFSEVRLSNNQKAYSSPFLQGYAGSYVCDGCLTPTEGVYRVLLTKKWLCGRCKEKIKSRKSIPASERLNFPEADKLCQESNSASRPT
jgi:hypothetical protein